MTKYVVSGYIGFDNFGDEAIALALTTYLKSLGAEKITLISSSPEKTSRIYGVESVGMLSFMQAVKESDVLISGGGSLLQDITSLKSLIYYLGIIMYAIALGKKVIIFAQGFTPFRTWFGKFFTRFALKRCHLVTVRDKKSQKFLEDLGVVSHLITDPVFGLPIPVVEKKSGVGIQLRGVNEGVDKKFLDKLADIVAEKFGNEEIKLFSLQDSFDLPILKSFAEVLSKKGIKSTIYKNLTVDDVLEKTSQLEFLIGMRFHSLLVASMAKVKVLGLKYDIKVETLSENIGFPAINISELELDEGVEALLNTNPDKYTIPNFKFPEI